MPARYEPLAPIAHGGMARLELARIRGEQGFEKYVAIKRILPQWAQEADFVAMFTDEARLVAKLDHPNIVHVYDFDRDDEGFFIAMEYIHGPSLLGLLRSAASRGEPVPLRHVVSIGMAIAAGLGHAHTRRDAHGRPLDIIHRDVSPTNVLVTYDGGVKLVDFGIAKAVSNKHATHGNARKGKVAYMSPEQCKAAPLDARSDLFALGSVLYELATGRRAFSGNDELALMNAIVNHDVQPPRSLRPQIPEALDAIIVQLLQRRVDDRPDTARDVERALEDLEGLKPSRSALGDWVAEVFGRRPLPWEAVPTDTQGPVSAVATGDDGETTRAVGPGAAVDSGSGVRSVAASPPTVTRTRPRPAWPWVVGGVALLGALGFGVAGRGDDGPASSRAPADERPTAEVKPEDAKASQAVVPEDGEPPGPAPAKTEPAVVSPPAASPAAAVQLSPPTPSRPVKNRRRNKKRPSPRPPSDVDVSTPPPPVTVEPLDPDGLAPRSHRD